MIRIKVVRNVILNNIDFYDQPSRMYVWRLPRIRQNFQIRKVQRFDKSDADISDLMIVF